MFITTMYVLCIEIPRNFSQQQIPTSHVLLETNTNTNTNDTKQIRVKFLFLANSQLNLQKNLNYYYEEIKKKIISRL